VFGDVCPIAEKRFIIVVAETTNDACVGGVLGQRVLCRAATRAHRLFNHRSDSQQEPRRSAGAGREVAGQPAGRGHGRTGEVNGHTVRSGKPNERSQLRILRVCVGGRHGVLPAG